MVDLTIPLDEAVERVRRALGDDIAGKCYTATEAVYRLAGGKDAGLMAVQGPAPDGPYSTHWWLKVKADGTIIDLTAAQFAGPVDYAAGKGRGFRNPSKAAAALMKRAMDDTPSQPALLSGPENLQEAASPRVLTQSELSTWLRCRRKWWLGYYRKLRRRNVFDQLPGVGTFVHAGLQVHYDPDDTRDPFDVVHARADALAAELSDHAEAIVEAANLACIMLEGYFDWLAETGADVGLVFDGAERQVEVALRLTPYILRGKIDATFVRKRDGARVQLEHKTVGNLTDIPKTAQQRFQFLTYDLLAFLAAMDGDGVRTDGVLVNMLRRVKRTASAKPPFYGRHEVRHNTQELRSHWWHVVAIARETDAAAARLGVGENHHTVVPPTPDRSCSWGCDFSAVCPLFDDGSDAEGFLAAEFEEHDPLARYDETEEA